MDLLLGPMRNGSPVQVHLRTGQPAIGTVHGIRREDREGEDPAFISSVGLEEFNVRDVRGFSYLNDERQVEIWTERGAITSRVGAA